MKSDGKVIGVISGGFVVESEEAPSLGAPVVLQLKDMRVVPREPTDSMLAAAFSWHCYDFECDGMDDESESWARVFYGAYRAMLDQFEREEDRADDA